MPVYARVMLICCFAAMLVASVLWAASYAWPIHPAWTTFKNESVKADFASRSSRAGVRVYMGKAPFMAMFDHCLSEVFREGQSLPIRLVVYPGHDVGLGEGQEYGRYAVVAFSYWFIIVASGLSAFLIWKYVPRRPVKGTCARCGYDLRASKSSCPECGQSFDFSDQAPVGETSPKLTP